MINFLKKSRIISLLISFSLISGGIGQIAHGEDNEYFNFHDDFSTYDETNSKTAESSNSLSGYNPHDGVETIAENSSGAKWESSAVWNVNCSPYAGRVGIAPDWDALVLRGWGGAWPVSVNLVTDDNIQIGKVQNFKFTTTGQSRISGLSLFVNEAENTFFIFGIRNPEDTTIISSAETQYAPFVAKCQNGAFKVIDYDVRLSGWRSSYGKIDWDITVADGYIVWTVKDAYGTEWSGSCDDDGLPEKYKYLCAGFGMGDGFSVINQVSITCGNYYDGGLGEPGDVLYRDIKKSDTADENGLIELDSENSQVRRVYTAVPKAVTDSDVLLSEDGEIFDTFPMEVTTGRSYNFLNWLNTENSKSYSYIKLPEGAINIRVLDDLGINDVLNIPQYETTKLYLYSNQIENTGGVWEIHNIDSSDEKIYATVSEAGELMGLKNGTTTLNVKGTNKTITTGICVKGDLAIAEESGDSSKMDEYIKNQRIILDALNDAVETKNQAAVYKFFFDDWQNPLSLARVDKVTTNALKSVDEIERGLLVSRFLSHEDKVVINDLSDVEKFEKLILDELYLSEINNALDTDALKGVLTKRNSNYQLPLTSEYYTSLENEILGTLLNKNYVNQEAFKNDFTENLIMLNVSKSLNSQYILELIEQYSSFIGFDTDKFNKKTKKTVAQAVIDDGNIKTTAELKNFIDNYKEPVKQTSTTTSGGGGGGGGGGGIYSAGTLPTSTKEPETTEEAGETVVSKKQLFSDVPTDFWGYEAIRYMLANNFITGYEDQTFKPDNLITRAEFITIALPAFKIVSEEKETVENSEETENSDKNEEVFSDLDKNAWYYDSMSLAYKNNIISGDNGLCNAEKNITRQEMAVIILRLLQKNDIELSHDTELTRFLDDTEIAAWSRSAVYELQAAGIVGGFHNCFNPSSNATRAEASQMIYKAINAKSAVTTESEVTE